MGEMDLTQLLSGDALKTILQWMIQGGLAGVLGYAAVDRWGFWLSKPDKRYAAVALTVILGALAYLAMVGLGYSPRPDTGQQLCERAFDAGIAAFVVSQMVHAKRDLASKDAASVPAQKG